MRKIQYLFFLFMALALILAACGTMTPPEAATLAPTTAAAPVEQNTAAPAEQNTAAPAAAAPTIGVPAAVGPAIAECRVDASTQNDPSLADQFPKVGNTDWSQGPDNAFLTIIEYSDFQ
jgi:hypothetical protein